MQSLSFLFFSWECWGEELTFPNWVTGEWEWCQVIADSRFKWILHNRLFLRYCVYFKIQRDFIKGTFNLKLSKVNGESNLIYIYIVLSIVCKINPPGQEDCNKYVS